MRVLVVSHLWPREDWLNFGIFVAEQAAALAQKCDVTIAVPADRTMRRGELTIGQLFRRFKRYRNRIRPELMRASGIDVRKVTYRSGLLGKAGPQTAVDNLQRSLEREIKESYDVIHAHTLFPDGLACAQWLKDSGVPLVVTAHGSDVHSVSKGIKKILPNLRRADVLTPVSRFLCEQLAQLGFGRERIHVIPNGFPADRFTGVDDSHRDNRKIVFLGNLGAVKRVDLLIRALQYCSEDIHLDIAGDGPARKKLEALVETLHLYDRVGFRGVLPREEVPRFLAGSSLMCLVSSKEGWPTVIYEALACGTPVLATSVGGIPEALADGNLGILVSEAIDPETLAWEIEAALEVDWDRRYIRQAAQQFSWDELTGKLVNLYQELLDAQRLHPSVDLSQRGMSFGSASD